MNYDFINNPDPTIIAFQKALGQKESHNTPTPAPTRITQTEGSVGRFQYQPGTFNDLSKRYFGGINPATGQKLDINNDLDQKLVNYAYVKDKKDQGYSPYDIAASWNAGEGRISNWQNMKGTNAQGNNYDVPAYTDEVFHLYQQNMRQLKDPSYVPNEYDPRRDTQEMLATDKDYAEQLKQQDVERAQRLQDYKNGPNILPDFLDPITDFAGDFSEGIQKDAKQFVGNIATTANDYLGFSNNPALMRGTESNKQLTQTGTEADGVGQNLGKITGEGIRLAAEAYSGGKLADIAFGSLAGGAAGATLQKAVLSQGVTGVLSRLGLSALAQQVPFTVDQVLQEGPTANALKDATIQTAITMVAEKLITKGKVGMFGNILDRVGKLKASGAIEEADKLMQTPEFLKELARNGVKNATDLENLGNKEIPVVRSSLQEILPTGSGLKVADMSDDAIKQVSANLSKTLDKAGNFNTIEDVTRMRKASGELMDSADQLSKNISNTLSLLGKNIDLPAFKESILRDIEQKVASRELLADEGKKFADFVERNLNTKPSKNGAFADLHNLRKRLNLDFQDANFDAARNLATKIRDVVKGMKDTPEMAAYKVANKTYSDLQDAEYVLAKLNKKGAGINKSMMSSLTGILASGGGFAPIQYFAGQRLGTYMADATKRAYTPKLIGNRFTRLGTNPLVDAHRAVKDAIENTAEKITQIKGEFTKKTANDLVNTLINAKTPQDIINAKKLLRQLADHPQFAQFKDVLNKKAAKINTRKELEDFLKEPHIPEKDLPTIQMGEPGVSKYKQVDPNLPVAKDVPPNTFSKNEPVGMKSEPYVPDNELPTIPMGGKGKTLADKAKDKMKASGIGLKTILSTVLGVGLTGSAILSPTDDASAMSLEDVANSNFNPVKRFLSSDPVEAIPPEEPQIKPAPVKPKPGVIGGYDISSYATNPEHEKNIEKIYNGVLAKRDFSTSTGIQEAITDNAPKSKITGEMILQASKKHDVDPVMLFSILLEDSQLGTTGTGSRNNNPGNVGQYDKLKRAVKGYPTLERGIEAVAKLLKKHKVE